ncbi:MAG TPA: class IV adenylate cyclase [Candidatus Omnitrophota bacterium]|nr:class IV adenylate cyclase [Candidatus Omnitrophota bacterium]
MGHLNVEIKARCGTQDAVRDILKSAGADFRGTDYQTDTYFRTSRGRLKLREGRIENCLVFYEREDRKGPKESRVILFPTEARSPVREILEKACGVLVRVEKEREIYYIRNVKFHLDRVPKLGDFVEIEAIDTDGTVGREKLHEQCRRWLEIFKIDPADLIDRSYADMLSAENA